MYSQFMMHRQKNIKLYICTYIYIYIYIYTYTYTYKREEVW